jgi:UDP-glucose 4-epimerase
VIVHLAAHAKVHELVREPPRARERDHDVQRPRVLPRQRLPLVFSSTREVYGDVHRFEEYGEATADFAFTESPYSASKIASEALIYSYARCYGLPVPRLPAFSKVYGRYDNDLARMVRVVTSVHRTGCLHVKPITIYRRQ